MIRAGSYIKVDPTKNPEPGCTVFHAGNLAPWNGQEKVDGVAVWFREVFR